MTKDAALATVDAVIRALHWHASWFNPTGRDNGCAECDKAWPCPTIRALDRAMKVAQP
jgi:hypothetical protein